MSPRSLSLALVATFGLAVCACWAGEPQSTTQPAASNRGDIVITIVYDNDPGGEGLKAAWGFSCVIQGLAKTILFDTGGDDGVMLANMRKLGLDPADIDAVVLSHIHSDHTGGLESFLKVRKDVPVYIPTGFPAAFKKRVKALGSEVIEAGDSTTVCEGAMTTGTLGIMISEQGLCVATPDGWVLITGCAHPGVENLAERAKRITGGPIAMVIGGFHMVNHTESQTKAVIDRLEELGVQRVAPCHCTGDKARAQFKERYGERWALPVVGSVLTFPQKR
jgi:7,8-dihydropterin-6-yl-methyl-4-(beta-D-ribofuranosyl)aminobenzene 5'-phosphate synthase